MVSARGTVSRIEVGAQVFEAAIADEEGHGATLASLKNLDRAGEIRSAGKPAEDAFLVRQQARRLHCRRVCDFEVARYQCPIQ